MKHKISNTWKDNMAFEADVNGFKIMLDADEAVGGENRGPKPKALTLVSLAGCTSMDVISILKKMRVVPEYFNVEVEGELTEEHPKYYHNIHVKYIFRGIIQPDIGSITVITPYGQAEEPDNIEFQFYPGFQHKIAGGFLNEVM